MLRTNTRLCERDSGSLLLELAIGLTVIAVGILGFFFVLFSNSHASNQMEDIDEVRVALESAAEDLRAQPFDEVYTKFHMQTLAVSGLHGVDGQSASIQVTCYVDETNLPPEFGPIQDLDGDGSLSTVNCSGTYKMLPVRLSLPYVSARGNAEVRELYLVIGEL